jgi:hypothetical protein
LGGRGGADPVAVFGWVHGLRTGPPSPNQSQKPEVEYGVRRAAYDLKKLRGKEIADRIGKTRRYEPIPAGLKAMTALLLLGNKVIKPLLAAAQEVHPTLGAQNPRTLDRHLETVRIEMQGVFRELGIAASRCRDRQSFCRALPSRAYCGNWINVFSEL